MRLVLILDIICILLNLSCSAKNPRGSHNEHAEAIQQLRIREFRATLLDEQSLSRLIQERHGKVLLINVWATWCQPCMKEFPDLIKLFNRYRDRGVDIVGISVDYTDEIRMKVDPFLKTLSVPFRVYVQNFNKEDKFIDFMDKSWNGAIPATFLYNTEGEMRYSIIGQRTYSQLKSEVDKLIASH